MDANQSQRHPPPTPPASIAVCPLDVHQDGDDVILGFVRDLVGQITSALAAAEAQQCRRATQLRT
jgi:hypothetical protein